MQCTIIFYTKYKILAKLSGRGSPKKKMLKPDLPKKKMLKPDLRQNGFSSLSSY